MIRRCGHICLDVGIVGLLAIVVLACIGGWRLSQGPISLGFLKSHLQEEMEALDLPYEVGFTDVVLTYGGPKRPLDLLIVDARLRANGDGAVARVPEISVKFGIGPLLRGKFVARRISLIGPQIIVARSRDEVLSVGLGGGGELAPGRPVVNLFTIDPVRASTGNGPWRTLEQLGIRQAELLFEDRESGLNGFARDGSVLMRKTKDGISGTFDLAGRIGDAEFAFNGSVDRAVGDGGTRLEVDFADMRPDLLAAELRRAVAGLPDLDGIAVPVAGRLTARLDQAGALMNAEYALTGAPGRIGHRMLGERRFEIRALLARGEFDAAADRLEIDRLEADLGGPALTLKASLSEVSAGPDIVAEADLRGMRMSLLERYWPKAVAKGARAWLTRNLNRGVVRDLKANLSARLEPSGELEIRSFDAGLRLEGAEVHFLRPLPPITNATAAVKIGPDSVLIRDAKGRLGALAASHGRVDITGLSDGKPRLAVTGALTGPFEDALSVIDHPRFRYATKIGLDPARVAGALALRVEGRFPLIGSLAISDVTLSATGTLTDGQAKGAIFGEDLSEATVDLALDTKEMRAAGKVKIAGVPADIEWLEAFDDQPEVRRRYGLRARLGPDEQARLGLDVGPILNGPVSVDAAYEMGDSGTRRVSGTLDLSEAALAIEPVDWAKPAGVPARARFSLGFVGERIARVRVADLTAADLVAAGSIELDETGRGIARASVDSLIVRDRFDFGGTVERGEDAVWRINANGSLFDARGFRKRLRQDGEAELPPVEVRAAFDRLLLGGAEPVSKAAFSLDYRDGVWNNVELHARHGNGKRMDLFFRTIGAERRLALKSEDAGRTLAILGVSDRVRDGSFDLAARRPASPGSEAPWAGELRADDFVLADAPRLASALRLASLGRLSRELDGSGVRVDRLRMPFAFAGGQIRLDDGRAIGRGFGVTAHGRIDLEARTVAVDGTIVPAYGLNSALGKVPGVGLIFSGAKGGGLFAAPYSVGGALDQPDIKVSALGALAPGILRNLFKGFDGKSDDPPPEAIPD